MSLAHFQGGEYNLRDYDPNLPFERTGEITFRRSRRNQVLDSAGALTNGSIQTWKYVRPVGPNRHEVQSPTNANHRTIVTSTQGEGGFTPGSYVTMGVTRQGAVIVGPPPQVSLSERPAQVSIQLRRIAAIIRQVPRELPRGATSAVTIEGYGFVSGMTWTAVEYSTTVLGPVPDPEITVDTAVFVNDQRYDLTVTVLGTERRGAPIGYTFEE